MTYEIETRKGNDGWEARSEATLGETPEGTRILKLRTSKTRGGLDTNASVCIRKDEGRGFISEMTEIFGDFYQPAIAPTECKRVTEKAVLEVHNRALLRMDSLITQAKAFYAERAAQNAPA
jgi:hypothetical protein